MSNTRYASEGDALNQERWASVITPESLNGTMVALRIEKTWQRGVEMPPEDVALIWYIQSRSMHKGGTPAFAAELIAQNPACIATLAMTEIGFEPGRIYDVEETRQVRGRGGIETDRFLLRGEFTEFETCVVAGAHRHLESDDLKEIEAIQKASALRPLGYSASAFKTICEDAGRANLSSWLMELCLNAEFNLSDGGPWYFPDAIETLRQSMESWKNQVESSVVSTRVVSHMKAVFESTHSRRSLSILEAPRSIGASFSAKSVCGADPGRFRYAAVPAGNDEESLVRAVTCAVGGTNALSYKLTQLKARAVKMLEASGVVLVLDHAQQLWPQTNLRRGHPSRMEWVLDLVKGGVPVVLIADEQFTKTLGAVDELLSWNCHLLTDRIGQYGVLPERLTDDEAKALSRAMLPGVSDQAIRAVTILATKSARSFRTLSNIVELARYRCQRDGRTAIQDDDVRNAVREAASADLGVVRLLKGAGIETTNAPGVPVEESPAPVSRDVRAPVALSPPRLQFTPHPGAFVGVNRLAGTPDDAINVALER